MKFGLTAILELLTRLWDSWDSYKRHKREEKIRHDYEKQADDPDAWFDAEFGSLPDPDCSENPPPKPTSKTNSNSE